MIDTSKYIERINSIIEGTEYKVAVFKVYYEAYENVLLKLVAKGKKNIKIFLKNKGETQNERKRY